VGQRGCSIYHTFSEHVEGGFHLGSEFDPDTLREQIAPIVSANLQLLSFQDPFTKLVPGFIKAVL
jgi:hypothetical protein